MKKFLVACIALILILVSTLPVWAEDEAGGDSSGEAIGALSDDSILISTYEELLAISNNPSGSYRLACDIDLAGKQWTPLDFGGVFDGAGYAILNCYVTGTTENTRLTYDGNMISYDTCFSGFFGIVENAQITNLSLLGIKVDTNVSADCFAGGIAGYTSDTIIENCNISGEVSLYVDGYMFGVGGAVGYGNGEIRNCNIDMTLICVDVNAEEKDEQFMGGVNGNGYMSIDSCNVTIRGYVSDHGYVHNGGLSGMFEVYPEGNYYYGFITNNVVSGYITFFEDNEDRRAYCVEGIGEDMSETHDDYGNEYNFESDERFEYDVNLLPETCDSPSYSATVVEPTEDSFGYTIYSCGGCGYSYVADYTLKKISETTKESEAETTTRIDEETNVAEASTIETTASIAEELVEKTQDAGENSYIWPLIIAGIIAVAIMTVVLVKTFKK